jgi:hypothetical protein
MCENSALQLFVRRLQRLRVLASNLPSEQPGDGHHHRIQLFPRRDIGIAVRLSFAGMVPSASASSAISLNRSKAPQPAHVALPQTDLTAVTPAPVKPS